MKRRTLMKLKQEKCKKKWIFKKTRDRQFADDGRGAEITVDLALQARAKMSENKVNGPEDAVVSEMNMLLTFLVGQMEAPSSWKIVKLVFLRKPDAEPKKGIRSYRATALTSVMSKWYESGTIPRLDKETEPENWKKKHVGGVDGISCQHLQVMMTNLPQKHWNGRKTERPYRGMEVCFAPQCIWKAWASRRRSMRQDRGTLRKSWKSMTPMYGLSQHSCARWLG